MAAITGTKITTARLAEYLSSQAERPVIDDTGLKGEYDFRVGWNGRDHLLGMVNSLCVAQAGLKVRAISSAGPVSDISGGYIGSTWKSIRRPIANRRDPRSAKTHRLFPPLTPLSSARASIVDSD